jgi:glycosyltransferase involved in cell wall biosynthesis
MGRIKVVFDDQIFCWQRFGGISRYYYELAKRVATHEGFSATVVAPLHVNDYLAEGGVAVRGMHMRKIQNSGRIISALNGPFTAALIRSEHPDVLHETYYYRRRSLAPQGCPTVVTVFDMTHEKFPERFLARDRTSGIKRAAVKRANKVICISANTQRDLIDIFGIPPEKTAVIHLGFTLTARAASTDSVIRNPPFLLFVGPRGGYKNFDALLDAYASSAVLREGIHLLAFGGGSFSAAETGKIRDLGLQGLVRQISGDDALLSELYRQAAALAYPSLYEGFGIPLLEAMSFDCPVICSNTSSLPEVAGDAALLFDPADTDSMRAALETVVGSDELRTSLVERGRERIKNFSWDKTAMETMRVYRELLQ